jgi:hypothetical protein
MQGLQFLSLRRLTTLCLLFCLSVAYLPNAARGQTDPNRLSVSVLPQDGSTVNAGNELTFSGSLIAPSTNTFTLSLDNYTLGLDNTFFTPDNNVFFSNTPATMAPGASYSGPLFGFTVASNTPPGQYTGLITISGSELDNNGNTVGSYSSSPGSDSTARFSFTVNPASAPEPASFVPLAIGALALGGLAWRRRRARASSRID